MQVRGPSSLVPGVPNVKTFYAGSLSCPGENLVRSSGFEPPRYCYRQPLKLVRLPVPPRPHRGKNFIVAALAKTGKMRALLRPSEALFLRPGCPFAGHPPKEITASQEPVSACSAQALKTAAPPEPAL